MPAPKPLKLVFAIEKDTKTKVRYAEVDPPKGDDAEGQPTPKDRAVVEKLYVSKRVLKDLGNPEILHVTIAVP